jgi:hypothetical protein
MDITLLEFGKEKLFNSSLPTDVTELQNKIPELSRVMCQFQD